MNSYTIPQEFNQSDKIGKFTMPQVVILGIAATIYVLIVMSAGLLLSIIAAIPLGALTVMFMFVKINKIPLYEFVLIYIVFLGSPKLLIYRSDNLKSYEEIEEGIALIDKPKKKIIEKEPEQKGKNPKKPEPKKKKAPSKAPIKASSKSKGVKK